MPSARRPRPKCLLLTAGFAIAVATYHSGRIALFLRAPSAAMLRALQPPAIDAPSRRQDDAAAKNRADGPRGAPVAGRAASEEGGQCRDPGRLFPPALPMSPSQRYLEEARGLNITIEAARREWRDVAKEGALTEAVAWYQLAMPNTGSTSMDGYIGRGMNMTPLQRAGECGRRACVQRIGSARSTALETVLVDKMGLDSSQLRGCEVEAFRQMSAVARCEGSGLHFDYSRLGEYADVCLTTNWRGLKGRAIFGTTLRDPIAYHHKLFGPGQLGFDAHICDFWANAYYNQTNASDGSKTFGFFCQKEESGERIRWVPGSNVGFQTYMKFAHHRWNLFTRNLAGTLAPIHSPIPLEASIAAMFSKYFTRGQALEQNRLGELAPDYKAAVAHLEAMPHFSIFERMNESIELLCFTYCYNCSGLGFSYKPHKRPPVPDEDREATTNFHKLDLLLYQHGNEVFTQRVNWMREAKAKGVQCDILMSGCGLSCA